jgi:tRNA(adenine34) deaminase
MKENSAARVNADMNTDEHYMRRAINLARDGYRTPGKEAIGCVIVLDGEIVGEGCNEVEARNDPTAHAEIVAMRQAGHNLAAHEFRGATLYSTLQPCGMCSMASIWAKLARIVYGAERHQVNDMYFEDRHMNTADFIADAFKNDIVIEGGVLGDECAALYIGPEEQVPEADRVNT